MQVLQSISLVELPDVGSEPDVCFGIENYLAVWSQGEFGGEWHIRVARVSPEGSVLDTDIVCGMNHYSELHPSVAFDGERYLVVWYNYIDPPAGIFGRFVNQECIPGDREFPIRELSINTNNDPDIAFLDSVYLVVWNEPSPYYDDDIYGQIVHMNGTLLGNAIPIVADSIYQYQARVCALDTMFVVVWNQNSRVCGQFIGRDGSLVGNNFQISDPPPHPRDFPDIARGGPQPLTVWHEFVDDDHEIYGDMEIFPGIHETSLQTGHGSFMIPTIVTEQLILPVGKKCNIYDITGRPVHRLEPAPGVYFISVDGQIVTKVVKVR
jgi:hypothetical protein